MNLEESKNLIFKIFNSTWVKWIHEGTNPAKSNIEKNINSLTATINHKHCAKCLNLNGCCFTKEIVPINPLHENCHCKTIDIDAFIPKITCSPEKFTKYIFDEKKSNGKKNLFESWGYSIIDADHLVQEFIHQSKLKYQSGEYQLGNLDNYGQRISIIISLPKSNTLNKVSFVSGWMVYPNGELVLTTPYGGK